MFRPRLHPEVPASTPRHPRPATTMVLLAAGLLSSAWMVWGAQANGHYDDFDVLHDSAVAWWEGRSIYDSRVPDPVPGYPAANLNPPHVTLVMAPLGRLPLARAAIVGWVGIALAILGCVAVWSRAMPSAWAWRALALILISSGSYYGIRLINTGWPLAFGLSAAWLAARRGRPGLAGALVGVCAATKVFFVLFVPYFLWRRDWRAAIGCGAGAAAVGIAGLLVEGPTGYLRWRDLLGGVRWEWMGANGTVLAALTRTFSVTPEPSPFAPIVVLPGWLLTVAWGAIGAALVAAFFRRFQRDPDRDGEWAAVAIGAMALSPMAWCYYWPAAVGPLAATYARHAAPVWLTAVMLAGASVPFLVFITARFSPLQTAIIGNAYALAVLAALAIVLRPNAGPAAEATRDGIN